MSRIMNRFNIITSLLVTFVALTTATATTGASCSSSGATTTATPFQRGGGKWIAPSSTTIPPTLFGIRGGGLFGNNGKDGTTASTVTDGSSSSTTATGTKKYPAMTAEEVEDWLEHVPVFAVTDSNGAGVVLKPDDDSSVFYFFLNPLAANATLTQLKSMKEDMDLKVSAFSLGKIWFRLLNGDSNQEVVLKAPNDDGGEGATATNVEYRLVPDTKDLLGARMLLTMNPEDGEKLKAGEPMTPEMAQKAVERAMTESPKFKATFNEIPVFTIAQMRMQKQLDEGETGEPLTLLPMYLSLQNMVGTWQQFMSQSAPEMQGLEPAINLLSLHDLIEMMLKESEIDFRHVVLVPPVPDMPNDPMGGASTASTSMNPMANMGGATLGDV